MTKVKNYPGNKKIEGVYQKIINNIPAHKYYYEMFAGSAAIAELLLEHSNASFILGDLDSKVTTDLAIKFSANENVSINTIDTIFWLNTIVGEIELNALGVDRFIFIDPPYLHSTRPNNTELYKHEMTGAQHMKMLSAAVQLKWPCMIIHPKCKMYDTMLKDWRQVEINIRYHIKTSREILYMNYPKPRTLQTDIFLGEDCWDRQRIMRKANRWCERLFKLPTLERQLIINQLKKQF